ncbi:MAG: class I SAM-dependent methyltransferase [Microthrixaceae bacterium]
MAGRNWDAATYDRIGGPMTQMAAAVVDRLDLTGGETVLDAGCGTGRVTRMLAELLPDGHVIAVDADEDMVRIAEQNLSDLIASDKVELAQGDLTRFTLPMPVDAILSTATFHWINDHQLLFDNLFSLLRARRATSRPVWRTGQHRRTTGAERRRHPDTSMITSALLELNTDTEPVELTPEMTALGTVDLAEKFTVEEFGGLGPDGKTVVNPPATGLVTVTFRTTALTPASGTPPRPVT